MSWIKFGLGCNNSQNMENKEQSRKRTWDTITDPNPEKSDSRPAKEQHLEHCYGGRGKSGLGGQNTNLRKNQAKNGLNRENLGYNKNIVNKATRIQPTKKGKIEQTEGIIDRYPKGIRDSQLESSGPGQIIRD